MTSRPRYTVGSVSGWAIGDEGKCGRFATIWYVYDTLFNHRAVAQFRGVSSSGVKARRDLKAATDARTLARQLNREQVAA